MKRNYNTKTTLENFEPMMRSIHWQSDELPVALVKLEGQYGNHVDVLFPSFRLAQKSFRLPTCARRLQKIFVLFLAPIGRKDPSTGVFKVFGRMWSSPPSFLHRRNQSRNHLCAWYEGLRGHVHSRNTRARRVGAAATAAGGVAAVPSADAAVSSGRPCTRRAPAHGSECRPRPRRSRPRWWRRRRRRRRGAPAFFSLHPAARPPVPSTSSSPPLPLCGPTYPPLPIHRVAAAHVRIAQLGLESALRQATTAQTASAGGCSDGGGRASVAAAARHGGGGRC